MFCSIQNSSQGILKPSSVPLGKMAMSLIMISTAAAVSYSRIHLQYHTTAQVLCGAVVGSVVALVWYMLVAVTIEPFFSHIENTSFAKMFLLKVQ